MDNDFLKGIKFTLGVIFTLGVLFGIVFAIGFHSADEILGGTFSSGTYSFSGSTVDFSGATVNGFSAGILIDSNLVCNSTNEGLIKYNTTSKRYDGCNGNNWMLIETLLILPDSYESCKDILDYGQSIGDGIYEIDVDGVGGTAPFNVYCDMTTDGGGWTLFLQTGSSLGSPNVVSSWGSLDLDDTTISGTAKLSDDNINLITEDKEYLLKCDKDQTTSPIVVDKVLQLKTTRDWHSTTDISQIITNVGLISYSFPLGVSESITDVFYSGANEIGISVGNSDTNSGWTVYHSTYGPYCGGTHNGGANMMKVFTR